MEIAITFTSVWGLSILLCGVLHLTAPAQPIWAEWDTE